MEEIKQLILELETEKKYNYKKSAHLINVIEKTKIDANLINWLKEECNRGNTWAQNILGCIYYCKIKEIDFNETFKLIKSSAEQGNANAQCNLGLIYHNKIGGVINDDQESIKWYKLSAEKGDLNAYNNLGYMYQYGYGVEKDYKEAIRFYKFSAEQGNNTAKYNLKYLYKNNRNILISLFLVDNMKIKELEKKNKELEKKNEEYEKEIEELKYIVPIEGGPEYQKAKKNFEEKLKKILVL
jgi:TPR repeat protein